MCPQRRKTIKFLVGRRLDHKYIALDRSIGPDVQIRKAFDPVQTRYSNDAPPLVLGTQRMLELANDVLLRIVKSKSQYLVYKRILPASGRLGPIEADFDVLVLLVALHFKLHCIEKYNNWQYESLAEILTYCFENKCADLYRFVGSKVEIHVPSHLVEARHRE